MKADSTEQAYDLGRREGAADADQAFVAIARGPRSAASLAEQQEAGRVRTRVRLAELQVAGASAECLAEYLDAYTTAFEKRMAALIAPPDRSAMREAKRQKRARR